MTRTILDIHVLQTLPPSNVNRDDTGSPKTATFGGALRARVSSQAWKRATRLAFEEKLDRTQLGTRTKRVVELVADRIQELAAERGITDLTTAEGAAAIATLTIAAAGIKVAAPRRAKGDPTVLPETTFLYFLSAAQITALAEAAIAASATDDPGADLKNAKLKQALHAEHSVDIALFGRMVADSTELNVDAAAQVAHALSVHAVETEFDYFTAVDDHKRADAEEDSGAGMIGTVEFNSSTLYRYATVDANRLEGNLGSVPATAQAVEAFVDAFVTSLPTGKQNTFANRTLPDAVVVVLRDTQPVNLVGAFETPIVGDRIRTAAERLAQHAAEIDAAFGTAGVQGWVLRVGDQTSSLDSLGKRSTLAELRSEIGAAVSERLGGGA